MAEVATLLPVPAPAAASVRADDPARARAALVGVVGLAAAGRAGPGGASATDVSAWVTANCSVVTIDGSTSDLYDCAAD